jgi:hypothetical protein
VEHVNTFPTLVTSIRFVFSVISSKETGMSECFLTLHISIRFHLCVSSSVRIKVGALIEVFPALLTFIGFLSTVSSFMNERSLESL